MVVSDMATAATVDLGVKVLGSPNSLKDFFVSISFATKVPS